METATKKGPKIATKVEFPKIEIANNKITLDKVKAKGIYNIIIQKQFKKPSFQTYFLKKTDCQDIEWTTVYRRIYKTTNEVKLRAFQYKILNNCLYLNKKLFLFNNV